jgi:GMP synthase (glutamine-hydrolysing)
VFVAEVKRWDARFLFHGTILTDIEETVAGIKRQHNILTHWGSTPRRLTAIK